MGLLNAEHFSVDGTCRRRRQKLLRVCKRLQFSENVEESKAVLSGRRSANKKQEVELQRFRPIAAPSGANTKATIAPLAVSAWGEQGTPAPLGKRRKRSIELNQRAAFVRRKSPSP